MSEVSGFLVSPRFERTILDGLDFIFSDKNKVCLCPKLGPPFLRHFQALIRLFAKELYFFVHESRLPCSSAALGTGEGGDGGVVSNYF